ncbi:hypothetical protein Nepgr_026447 [Nepenthes gracilis]|uniref:Dof zinc finger protein n=1 Tax=Nepenthes gracilis TaxID=150966 RepID=A0AAD3T912_NEPGR|nr:hypothetical protein Nepgr_026447 [Nepenthes gracilis]
MIQELLGGGEAARVIGSGERKISIAEGLILQASFFSSPSPTPSPALSSSLTPSSSSTAAVTTTTTSNSETQNLRCPRCDSTNTKFCYYNNYNLTQPRHFCKTCRRYWTKGGALRNVPIGGGCRKNKSSSAPSSGKSCGLKAKTTVSMSEFGKQSHLASGFDHDLNSNPFLWPSTQNSHISAILRAAKNPNPSPLSNAFPAKSEVMIENHEPGIETSALNARTLGFDLYNEAPSIGLCSTFFRNGLHHQNNGLLLGEVQNSGIHEVIQRLKTSTANYYHGDHPALALSKNAAFSTSSAIATSSPILDTAPVIGADLSFFNHSSLSWSDLLPTSDGAYP